VALFLLLADDADLVLWFRLGHEVVDARLVGDGRRGQRVVARDHDGSDTHAAELFEPLTHAWLHGVFQVDAANDLAIHEKGERRPALAGDPFDGRR
jgi:hypothetical protein